LSSAAKDVLLDADRFSDCQSAGVVDGDVSNQQAVQPHQAGKYVETIDTAEHVLVPLNANWRSVAAGRYRVRLSCIIASFGQLPPDAGWR
jgi:hypothetical protein